MITPKEIITGYKSAKDSRSVIESVWEDTAYYVLPRKRGITTKITPGDKTPADVYNATPQQSNVILAAGLAGFLTNPAQRWFELGIRQGLRKDDVNGKRWLADATDILFDVLDGSNFYNQSHEMYLDFGPFGSGVLYEEEDEKNDIRFYSRHPRECYCVENARGIIDMVYRSFELSCYQAVQFFGRDVLPEEILKCYDEKKNYSEMFSFVHYVAPRSVRDPRKKDSVNKPFMSIWISEKNPDRILKESGFDEFPFFIPRFYKNSGETYGYGPAHGFHPDIKMLNNATKLYYQSTEVSLFPPTIEEHDSVIGTLDMRSKARNFQRQPLNRGVAVQPLLSGANYQISLDFLDKLEQKIEKAFFVDLFLALRQTKRMTATEVLEISQERMFMLGPVLGRLQHEYLDPMIERTFNILLRRGVIPAPPESIMGLNYKVKYISPLARAQRALQARDMQAFFAIIGQMHQLAPSVLDKINPDETVDELSEMYSISPKIILGDDEVNELRALRAQQAAEQQKMLQLQQGAQIARDASQASKGFAEARTIA